MPHLTFVVCGNGLGHVRRTIRVLDVLLRHHGTRLNVDLYAEPWQLSMLSDWHRLTRVQNSGRVRFHTELTGAAAPVHLNPAQWDETRYGRLLDFFRGEAPLREADLVVSDNLAGVLAIRSDAVLMGSFLWHDVLGAADLTDAAILSMERQLLERIRPPMLCVGEMVMPEVERVTDPVRLSWFCEREHRARPRWPLRTVLLSGGATGAVHDALRELAVELVDGTNLTVLAPRRITRELALDRRLQTFTFSRAEFGDCDLAIGRPGMGLLTDCVRFAIPLLCSDDENNPEMCYNAARIEALGIGRRVSLSRSAQLTRWVREEMSRSQVERWIANLEARPTGGTEGAARFLANRLNILDNGT